MNFDKYKNPITYSKQVKALYDRAEKECRDEFRHDLENEFGVPHDAYYANKLYEIAWREGHSEGYSGVYNEYSDLTELVDVILKKE